MRAAARHIEAGGVGYNKGYTTLETFLATDPSNWSVMPFLDLRGHVFNDGKLAANAGLGARATLGCRVYGLNAYYDYRNSHHKGYNQVGAGLETLGDTWDFRVNGYLPVGKKVSKAYDVEFAEFSGHSILVNRKFRYAMKGIDAEAGFHFGKTSNFDFYAAAGPYYFKGDMGKAAFGGKARLAASFKEYITVEVSDSYDAVFHNNVQGQLTLSFPFGPRSNPKMKSDCCPNTCDFATTLATRMVQPVARQEIVVLDTHKKKSATDDFVIFVDNLSSSDGTYESPYHLLSDAQDNSNPGNIIYVFPGDGTTTGMDDGIILQDNQKFWGSGVDHTLNTNLGTIVIPALTSTSPEMTNTDGYGVELAANNEVSGFIIAHTTSNAIYGSDMGDVSILSSVISYSNETNGYLAIELYPSNGVSNILLDDLMVINNGSEGIYIQPDKSAEVNITVSNSFFSGNTWPLDIEGFTSSSTNATVFNNEFSSNSQSVYFVFDNSTASSANVSFDQNIIAGVSSSYGMEIYPEGSTSAQFSMADTVITDSNSYGLYIAVTNQSDFTMNIDHCEFSGNSGNALYASVDTDAVMSFTLHDSAITDNTNSVSLNSTSTSTSTFLLTDNMIVGTTSDNGLYASFSNSGPIELTANNNLFSNSNNNGCRITTSNTVPLNAAFSGNSFQGNGDGGFDLQSFNASVVCLDMRNNASVDNSSYQYRLHQTNTSALNVSPCNAADINVGDLFDGSVGTIGTVESCPSGTVCP
jgi:hypothetical protein